MQGIIPATATPILGDYHKPLQETPYLNNQDSMDFVRDPGFFGGSSGIMEQSITSAEIREGTLIGAVSLSKVFIIGRTVYRSSTANGAQPLKHPPKFIGPLLGTITYPHLGGMFEEDFPFPKGGYGVVPSWPSRTALHLAAVNGQTESLQTLLFYKADYEKLRLNEVNGIQPNTINLWNQRPHQIVNHIW